MSEKYTGNLFLIISTIVLQVNSYFNQFKHIFIAEHDTLEAIAEEARTGPYQKEPRLREDKPIVAKLEVCY